MLRAHKQMLGRVEFERRRLGREYARMVKALRSVATEAAAGGGVVQQPLHEPRAPPGKDVGNTPLERAFHREFGGMLGLLPGQQPPVG